MASQSKKLNKNIRLVVGGSKTRPSSKKIFPQSCELVLLPCHFIQRVYLVLCGIQRLVNVHLVQLERFKRRRRSRACRVMKDSQHFRKEAPINYSVVLVCALFLNLSKIKAVSLEFPKDLGSDLKLSCPEH